MMSPRRGLVETSKGMVCFETNPKEQKRAKNQTHVQKLLYIHSSACLSASITYNFGVSRTFLGFLAHDSFFVDASV